jgi:hypothetical protein
MLPPLSLGLAVEPWQFYAAMALGDVRHVDLIADDADADARPEHWLLASDGSWARQDGTTIQEGGQRQLWTELEAAYDRWHDLGKPERQQFGLTVTPERQELWLDHPAQVVIGPSPM